MRPDAELTNAFVYCLGVAATKIGIQVLGVCAMSNHYHAIVHDPHGHVPAFLCYFHQFLGKCINALRGRSENAFAMEATSMVRLVSTEDVIAKLVYTLSNPVKDNLVDKATNWPGCNSYLAFATNRPLTASRPTFYFRQRGTMPEQVNLSLSWPDQHGSRFEAVARVKEGVEAIEALALQRRTQSGRTVLGRLGVLAQKFVASPTSPRVKGGLRPTIAARSKWHRIEALLRNRQFLQLYRAACIATKACLPALFPPGTYWRKRFLNVEIVTTS